VEFLLKPREIDSEAIETRVREFPDAPAIEGVTPLNTGFFKLERMRMAGPQGKVKLRE
jgi:hypothetical protein